MGSDSTKKKYNRPKVTFTHSLKQPTGTGTMLDPTRPTVTDSGHRFDVVSTLKDQRKLKKGPRVEAFSWLSTANLSAGISLGIGRRARQNKMSSFDSFSEWRWQITADEEDTV